MKKNHLLLLLAIGFSIMMACNDEPKVETKNETETPSDFETQSEACFMKADGKDTTFVSIKIDNNQVTGKMDWKPYEKDGAYGTLSGVKNANDEMMLSYKYTIEGSTQTSEEIMKIENDKLLIKKGELIDPKNDGNTKLKDPATAVYMTL